MCYIQDCNHPAKYNYKNKKSAKYCFNHKLDDMFITRCIIKDCNTCPSFNYENETKVLYCSKHKFDNMIDIN